MSEPAPCKNTVDLEDGKTHWDRINAAVDAVLECPDGCARPGRCRARHCRDEGVNPIEYVKTCAARGRG